MRFVPPVAALADGPVALRRRPARPRAPDGHRARRAARARRRIDGDARCRSPSHGTGALRGGEVVIDASASSQFVSGLLLVRRRATTKGVDGRPRRQAGAVAAAHRHDRRDAARAAGWSVDDGDAEHVARRPGPDRAARLGRRARPVQRRGVPRRGGGHRRRGHASPAGPSAPPSPGRASCPTCSSQMGADGRARPTAG